MTLKNIIITVLIIGTLTIFLYWQNNAVVVTKYKHKKEKVPNKFNGYKILHISDLHNKNFYGRLTKKINKVNPDIVVITGDLIDRRKTRVDVAIEFIEEIINIAPIYYVTGNHEQFSDSYDELKKELEKLNVCIVDNSYIKLNSEGDEIGLLGISDPAIIQRLGKKTKEDNTIYAESIIKDLYKDITTDFNILLSHRPELFNVYRVTKMDLVFCGHAHGGQIRIPFLDGILSPNQGFLPKYSEGMIVEEDTAMVVSRGLGNSIFPFRIFNRPELVVVELKRN